MKSDQIDMLMTALAKAQGEMGHASKDSTNPHFKSRYADLASVWQACREPLAKNSLAVVQTVMNDSGKQFLVTILGHSSGQWIESRMELPLTAKPQEMGSMISYFRRYSLAAICGVYQDDDDAEIAQSAYRKSACISTEQAEVLRPMLRELPDAQKAIFEKWGLNRIEDFPSRDFKLIHDELLRRMKMKGRVDGQDSNN